MTDEEHQKIMKEMINHLDEKIAEDTSQGYIAGGILLMGAIFVLVSSILTIIDFFR